MGAIDARPSVRLALSHTVALKRFPLVVAILCAASIASRFPTGAVMFAGLAGTLLAGGFLLSYSRSVAFEAGDLPDRRGLGTYLRRGLGMTVLGFVVALLFGLPLLLLSWAADSLLVAASPEVQGWLTRGAVTMGVALITVALVPISAAYIRFDNVRDALRVRAALGLAWMNRGLIAVPILFGVATGVLSLSASYALGRLLNSRMLVGFPEAAASLARGQWSADGAIMVVSVLLLAALSAVVELMDAHLTGQYCALVYSDADDASVWSA